MLYTWKYTSTENIEVCLWGQDSDGSLQLANQPAKGYTPVSQSGCSLTTGCVLSGVTVQSMQAQGGTCTCQLKYREGEAVLGHLAANMVNLTRLNQRLHDGEIICPTGYIVAVTSEFGRRLIPQKGNLKVHRHHVQSSCAEREADHQNLTQPIFI